ncbi:MAG: topoisomerase C-terminal repeat-containing protein, partial [Clostridia bacterium]|nr:topoisomerase C-terminal repeat-containing protein [Clostridia bacterium]
CNFKINYFICGRVISKRNAALMLESGKTSLIKGFVSRKSGKSFDAFLKLEDGKAVFEFK